MWRRRDCNSSASFSTCRAKLRQRKKIWLWSTFASCASCAWSFSRAVANLFTSPNLWNSEVGDMETWTTWTWCKKHGWPHPPSFLGSLAKQRSVHSVHSPAGCVFSQTSKWISWFLHLLLYFSSLCQRHVKVNIMVCGQEACIVISNQNQLNQGYCVCHCLVLVMRHLLLQLIQRDAICFSLSLPAVFDGKKRWTSRTSSTVLKHRLSLFFGKEFYWRVFEKQRCQFKIKPNGNKQSHQTLQK